jgi:2-polyprenyl-3-methyl-5-hydroxy-6-metoxy-1,4-benzoquinol methylase
MKVVVCPQRDEAGKYRGVVQAFPDIGTGHVLDVGCRSGGFGTVLREGRCSGDLTYCGLDLRHPADVIADLEQGLPFQAETHDVVVALDVLEHTNDLHRAFTDLCRVSGSSS